MELGDMEEQVEVLREQVKLLTTQFFQEKQLWMAERKRLEQSATAGAAAAPPTPGASAKCLGSSACSDAGELTDCASSFTYSMNSGSAPSIGHPSSAGSLSPASCRAEADLYRQLEDARKAHETASARWSLEKEALQRQLHTLVSTVAAPPPPLHPAASASAAAAAAAAAAAVAEAEAERAELVSRLEALEGEVEGLQAERCQLEEQLRVATMEASRAARAAVSTCSSAHHAPPLSPATSDFPAAPPSPASAFVSASSLAAAAALAGRTPSTTSPASAFSTAHASASAAASPASALQQQLANPHAPQAAPQGPSAQGGWGLTLTDSVSVPALLSEKADLERELRRLREECVAVPRAEYSELSSVRAQLAFMARELEELRADAEEAARAREEAEAALAELQAEVEAEAEAAEAGAAGGEHARACAAAAAAAAGQAGVVALPRSEHEALLAAAQERDALAEALAAAEQAAEAATQHAAQLAAQLAAAQHASRSTTAAAVPASLSLPAAADGAADSGDGPATPDSPTAADSLAVRGACSGGSEDGSVSGSGSAAALSEAEDQVACLRDQLAGAVEAAVAEGARLSGRVAELEAELERLRGENTALAAEAAAFRTIVVSGQGKVSESVVAAATAAEEARALAAAGLVAAQRRIGELEAELANARSEADSAVALSEELRLDMDTMRDVAVRATEALAEAERGREAAEAAAAAARQGLEAAQQELGGARELEALFRRDVVRSRRLQGLPAEWISAAASSASTSSAGSGTRSGSASEIGSAPASKAVSVAGSNPASNAGSLNGPPPGWPAAGLQAVQEGGQADAEATVEVPEVQTTPGPTEEAKDGAAAVQTEAQAQEPAAETD